MSGLVDTRTPPLGERYYAVGRAVKRHPLRSSRGISMGFVVCTLSDDVDDDGAQEIADALNAADAMLAERAKQGDEK